MEPSTDTHIMIMGKDLRPGMGDRGPWDTGGARDKPSGALSSQHIDRNQEMARGAVWEGHHVYLVPSSTPDAATWGHCLHPERAME